MSRAEDHLLNAAGAAKLLGISRQRVNQLIDEDPTFPSAIAVLGRTPVWRQGTIVQWAEKSGRAAVYDERETWIKRRPAGVTGANATTEPLYVVHLVNGLRTATLCGLGVDDEIGQAGFDSIDERNQCQECAEIAIRTMK